MIRYDFRQVDMVVPDPLYTCSGFTIPDAWNQALPYVTFIVGQVLDRLRREPLTPDMRTEIRCRVEDMIRRSIWGTCRHIKEPLHFSFHLSDGSTIVCDPFRRTT